MAACAPGDGGGSSSTPGGSGGEETPPVNGADRPASLFSHNRYNFALPEELTPGTTIAHAVLSEVRIRNLVAELRGLTTEKEKLALTAGTDYTLTAAIRGDANSDANLIFDLGPITAQNTIAIIFQTFEGAEETYADRDALVDGVPYIDLDLTVAPTTGAAGTPLTDADGNTIL